MAKQDFFLRYLAIIKTLRTEGEVSFSRIRESVEREAALADRPVSFSIRTFQRDVEEIRGIFGIDIRFDFSRKVYLIEDDGRSELQTRMLESVDTINSLNLANDIGQFMIFEKRKAQGTQHFYGLLHAIRNRITLAVKHRKFDSDVPSDRMLEPLALKESKGRWYLLARDTADRRYKTFGLDRILSFENTPKRFDVPRDFDANAMFRYCFGVINPDNQEPPEIILSFRPEQGNYIRSYPLHDTQTILADTEQEFRIGLRLHPTYDFIMEILSYGETVTVISPVELRDRMAQIFRKATENYM